jgi:uncharacterized membrane protein
VADLVCVAFDDPTTADRALTELTALQKEYLIELKDACVVVRSPDGDVHLHQAVPLVRSGARTIKPNSSALFLLVQRVTADKVLPRMTEFRGRVLKTSLSDEREKRLREALGDTAASAA